MLIECQKERERRFGAEADELGEERLAFFGAETCGVFEVDVVALEVVERERALADERGGEVHELSGGDGDVERERRKRLGHLERGRLGEPLVVEGRVVGVAVEVEQTEDAPLPVLITAGVVAAPCNIEPDPVDLWLVESLASSKHVGRLSFVSYRSRYRLGEERRLCTTGYRPR